MNNKSSINTISLLALRERAIIVPSKASRTSDTIAMEAITQKQEDIIDKLDIKQGIYFYGDLDLNNSEDIKHIRDYNLVHNDGTGLLYNDFNYDTADFKLQPVFNGKDFEQQVKWGPCIDAVKWFQYHHCLIGKPKKVIVFNVGINEYWKKQK